MRIRSMITATIVSMLLTGSLLGCTSKPDSPATKSPEPKRYEIKLFHTRLQPNADSEVMEIIREKLGQHLIISTAPDADYVRKLNLLYASNDLPDIFTTFGDAELLENATAKFTEEEFKTYMPRTYAAALKQYEGYGVPKESAFSRFMVKDKLAGIFIGQTEITYPYGLIIRKDLLDEFRMKTPVTLVDWEAFLKAYKTKYPSKYPLTARGKDAFQQSFYPVLAAFGINYDTWLLRDNKLVYSGIMPEMREALVILNKWYKAGYINPEWITMDIRAVENEWINGNTVLYAFSALRNKIQPPFDPGSIYELQAAKHPQTMLEWIPFPKAKPHIKPALNTYEGVLNQPLAFGKQLEKDPNKLHAVMTTVDKLKNDKELILLQSYGVLGKTYDMVDGLPVVKKEYNNADAQMKAGFGWLFPGGNVWDITKTLVQKNFLENIGKYAEAPTGLYSRANTEWAFNRVNGPLLSLSGENLSTKARTKQEEYNRMFAEVIIGSKSLDDWDKYIEQYKTELGNDMTEAANRLYLKQWLN